MFLFFLFVAVPAQAAAQQQYILHKGESLPVYSVGQKFRGRSAWYGRRAHGNRTASGSRFDLAKMTAAHRTLPFGTRARVTNMRNGRSVIVEVTDRGPADRRYCIDISRAAAEKIGARRAGEANVEVEILSLPAWYDGKARRRQPRR